MTYRTMRGGASCRAQVVSVLAFLLVASACGGQPPAGTAGAALDPLTLNTFINDSIQIDQLGTGFQPDDANLFTGNDPADGTASANLPAGGPGNYIDWNDLGSDLANHVVYDFSSGKDPTAFPQSNECVASAQVLAKMDLTYISAATNVKYSYFALQRADNNGDAGYYWIFTKLPPRLIAGQAPCSATQQRLLYDISPGDVLLAGTSSRTARRSCRPGPPP